MADTSLIFNIIARDKTSKTLEKIKANANSTGVVVAKMLGPAIVPILGVATGGALALGSALAAAGAGAGVFGAVLKTAMGQVNENATKLQGLNDKMALYGRMAKIAAANGKDNSKYLKKQSEALLELNARLSLLPPAEREATRSFMMMKRGWSDFVDANKPEVFGIMQRGYTLISGMIGKLQPLFDAGASAANQLITALAPLGVGDGLTTLGKRAAPALKSLTSIIINVATAIGRTFGAFASDGQGILQWIERATKKWADWTNVKAGGGLQAFVDYFHKQGPGVMQLLTNLAGAAVKIVQAVSPLAPISMAIASGLTALLAAMPVNVLTGLVAAWIAYSTAVKIYSVWGAIGTAVQWDMNVAFLASPITWIVAGILLLVGVIVLVATKTRFFQTVWAAVWGFMKGVGAWFAGPFANYYINAWHKIVSGLTWAKNAILTVIGWIKSYYVGLWHAFQTTVGWITGAGNKLVNWFRAAPGRIRGALSGMFNGLWSGFRSVVNRIIAGWNNLSFGIPGFSFAGMSFGGMSVGTPNIPYLASGGMLRSDGLFYGHAGETVTKKAQVTRTGSGAGNGDSGKGATITIGGSNAKVVRVLLELLREGIRDQGGDVVKVLAPR